MKLLIDPEGFKVVSNDGHLAVAQCLYCDGTTKPGVIPGESPKRFERSLTALIAEHIGACPALLS